VQEVLVDRGQLRRELLVEKLDDAVVTTHWFGLLRTGLVPDAALQTMLISLCPPSLLCGGNSQRVWFGQPMRVGGRAQLVDEIADTVEAAATTSPGPAGRADALLASRAAEDGGSNLALPDPRADADVHFGVPHFA
jgi:hypothetical protein